MLSPRLTDCPECSNIPNLLQEIDCKLAEYANSLYNNIVFMLNQVVPAGAMIQLLAYKRILTYKQCNPDYLSDFCMDKIVSKVIRLTLGCDIRPVFTPIPTTSTTSTSTTCPPYTTTTSTSSTSSTTSTTTTLACNAWLYNISLYYCDTCFISGEGSLWNSEPLTIDKWYTYQGLKIKVDSYVECNANGPDEFILDSSKEDTCEAVICPTTTTTTTI